MLQRSSSTIISMTTMTNSKLTLAFNTFAAVLIFFLAALLAGCDAGAGAMPIGEITQSASTFEGREVKLRGAVTQLVKLPFADSKSYRLKDATGEIVVWTTGTMPGEGEEVVVHGRVENIAIVSGQSLGLTLKEIERRPPGMRMPWQ
jgi:hypothetical protein